MITAKRQMHINGAVWLLSFSFLLACNQIAIKLASVGLQPVLWLYSDAFCIGLTWYLDVVAKITFLAKYS